MSRLHPVRLGWLSFAAAVLGVLWAAPAFAHALATGSEPAPDDVLDSPPGEVVVEFNEPVTPVDAATGVVAPDGDRADTGIVESDDPTTVVIGLDADIEGTYLVGYRVVSDDGHPVSGTFTFSVGRETEAPSAEALIAETDPLVQGLLYAERGVGYAGLALALGAGVLLAVGARPRDRIARLVATGLSAVAACAIVGIVLQAAYESGVPISGLDGVALQSVMESSVGLAALLRLLLVLLALPLLRFLVTDETPGRPVLAGLASVALALAATWPLAGHPMATEPVALAFAADWIHTAAALTWAGGVAVLFILACSRRGDVPERAREFWVALVPWLMASLIVAGLASALLHIDSIEALTDTAYGRLVALKAAILIAIVAVGLFTRKAVLRGAEGRTALRRLAGAEAVLAAAILAAVVVLVQAVPAKTALLETGTSSTVESTGTATLFTTDAFSGQLALDPGRPGPNSVRIITDGPGGEPFEAVEWDAVYGLEGAEPETLRLIELRTGILGGEVSLPEAGRWVFVFTLTDAEGHTATAEAAVDVSLPVAEGPSRVLTQLHAPFLEVASEVVGQEARGVVRQCRVVAVAAHRHRRHERGVGLDQDQFGGCDGGRAAQLLGVLERHVPREAHVEPAPGAFVREREVAREAVEDHPVRSALFIQDGQDVGVGVAVVDDQGLAAALGDLDVGAEGGLLGGPAALVGAEVVQAGLAERGDAGRRGEFVDGGERAVEVAQERGLVRVEGDRGQDPLVGLGERCGPAGGGDVGADLDEVRDADGLGLVDELADLVARGLGRDRLIGGVAGADDVEVRVRVGDRGRKRRWAGCRIGFVHASTMPRRLRSAVPVRRSLMKTAKGVAGLLSTMPAVGERYRLYPIRYSCVIAYNLPSGVVCPRVTDVRGRERRGASLFARPTPRPRPLRARPRTASA